MSISASLREDLEAVIQGLGFTLLEANTSTVHGRTHVHVVVYSRDGVTIDACAEIHKTIMPRLELVLDDRDVALQVASPGIDRVMKEPEELRVFGGKGVQILRKSTQDWVGGVVVGTDDRSVVLATGREQERISFDDIQKAKLDFTQEVVKTDVE